MSLPDHLKKSVSRLGLHGDLLTRMQAWGARRCPYFLEVGLLSAYSLLFFLICGKLRRTINENVEVIRGKFSWFAAYHVIRSFSGSLTDSIRRRSGEDVIEWEIEGAEHVDALKNSQSGAILLTAHMGNYDLAAKLFAERFARRIHAVRMPERQANAQKMREEELKSAESEKLAIRYNDPDGMLGVELMKALQEGEIVAVQGDRVVFDVSTILSQFNESHAIAIPKGPLFLAAASQKPIFPIFIVNTGYRRYRIIARPPFECRRQRGVDQDEVFAETAETWINTLRPILQRYWEQWYVYEPAFEIQTAQALPA